MREVFLRFGVSEGLVVCFVCLKFRPLTPSRGPARLRVYSCLLGRISLGRGDLGFAKGFRVSALGGFGVLGRTSL